jgi:hypothetical protein
MPANTMMSTRRPNLPNFNAPLVLEPPRHCGLPSIALVPGRHLIGTAANCGIRLNAEGVVDWHALILVGENRTVVKSMDPRTWVNDGPVSEMALRHGDRLSVGPVTFRVRSATREETAAFADNPPAEADVPPLPEFTNPTATEPPALRPVSKPPPPPVATRTVAGAEPVGGRQVRTDSSAVVFREPVRPAKPVETVEGFIASPAAAATSAEVVSPVAPASPPNGGDETASPQKQSLLPQVASSAAPVRPDNVPSTLVANVPPTLVAEPPEPSPSAKRDRELLDARLDEIQQRLSDLRVDTQSFVRPVDTGDANAEADAGHPMRQLQLRLEVQQRRAEQVAVETQRLQARADKVAEREALVERRHQQLASEAERIADAAESARRHLAEEHAKHAAVWQDWEAACQRMGGELATQLDTIERQRAAMQVEADRLADARTELQCARAEYERDRLAGAADRVRLTNELAELASVKSRFEEERRQYQLEAGQLTVQLEADRVELQSLKVRCRQVDESLAQLRQQRDTESSVFAQTRENDLRVQSELQMELDEDRRQLAAARQELDELRRTLSTSDESSNAENARAESSIAESSLQLEAARVELQGLKVRCQQAEESLAQLRQQQEVERSSLARTRENDLRMQSELQMELDEDRRQLAAARQELDELRRTLAASDESTIQLETTRVELRSLTARCQQAEEELTQLRLQREVESATLAQTHESSSQLRPGRPSTLEEDHCHSQTGPCELVESQRTFTRPVDQNAETLSGNVVSARPSYFGEIPSRTPFPTAFAVAPPTPPPFPIPPASPVASPIPPPIPFPLASPLPPPIPFPVASSADSLTEPPIPYPIVSPAESPIPPPIPPGSDPSDEFGVIVNWDSFGTADPDFGQSRTDRRVTADGPSEFSSFPVPLDGPSDWPVPQGMRPFVSGDDPWGSVTAVPGFSPSLHEVAQSGDDTWAAAAPMAPMESSFPDHGSADPYGGSATMTPGACAISHEIESNFFGTMSAGIAEPFATPDDLLASIGQPMDASETLAEVNREFGVPDVGNLAEPDVAASLPSWWVDGTPATATAARDSEGTDPNWGGDVLHAESTGSGSPPSETKGLGGDLRTQLALLFDLPGNAAGDSENVASVDFDAASNETSPDVADAEPSDAANETSPDRTGMTAADTSPDDGTPATGSGEPPFGLTTAAPPSVPVTADDEEHVEDSVEAFMARLLARSRTGPSEPSPPAPSASHGYIRLPNRTEDPSAGACDSPVAQRDRSHLTAEPIHKQDREAVREHLQSFRQVAHLSARSALARHSLQQLRNATIAKGVLVGASAVAVTAFFTEPLWGTQLQLWKGIGCSIALALSVMEFARSWTQLHRPIKVPPELARAAEAAIVTETHAGPESANGNMESEDRVGSFDESEPAADSQTAE